jgi:hypothetical protein
LTTDEEKVANIDHGQVTTIVDDASDLFVAEISPSSWLPFCENVPHCLMEIDGEDPMLDAYLHRSLRDQAISFAQVDYILASLFYVV